MLTIVKNQIRHIGSALWFRPAVFSLIAILVALAIATIDTTIERGALPWLPEIDLSTVRDLLTLLAGSMLTVVTVTLSVLMLVLSLVTGQASPRAVPELMADPITQNALGTFLATFVFSLTCLLFFGLGAITGAGITLTFVAGLVYVATAIRYFVQWIGHVAHSLKLNRMIERIHAQARSVLDDYLAAEPSRPGATDLLANIDGKDLRPRESGYVQFIDVDAMDTLAEDKALRVKLHAREGSFVHPGQRLMTVAGLEANDDASCGKLCRAVVIGFERSHKGDPLLGFELLAEVASRALSPGVNDPRTAISCIDYAGALLCRAGVVAPKDYPRNTSPRGHVFIERPGFESMIKRALLPVARDGAPFVEVLDVLLDVLGDLAADCDRAYLDALDDVRLRVSDFGRNGLTLERDKEALEARAQELGALIVTRRRLAMG